LVVVTIGGAPEADVDAITAIQNAFITTHAIEWTDTPHTAADRKLWLARQHEVGLPVLVAIAPRRDEVVGWASFGPFRDWQKWPGYRLTVEHTIHVREDHWGAGAGRELLSALVERAVARGFHVMVGAIDGENTGSIRFHERLGFTEVARMPEVGTKHGRWLDLVLMQRILSDAPPPPR
jgi:phosphinothricin acetyltransferase